MQMESVLLQNVVVYKYDIQMFFSPESFGHLQFQSVMQFLMDRLLVLSRTDSVQKRIRENMMQPDAACLQERFQCYIL